MAWFFPIKMVSEANQSGGRSTILRPLIGLGILCITACICCFAFHVPDWIGTVFAATSFLIILLAIYAYIFCLHTDKDALRSEWFSINKKAIEHGLLGDDKVGILTNLNNPVVVNKDKINKNMTQLGGDNE